MTYGQYAGSWVYRSFINRPEALPILDPTRASAADIEAWARYLFGQGVMTLHPTATGGLTGTLRLGAAADRLDMTLRGKFEQRDGQTWVLWNAQGLPNTPTDGWLYEYEGHLINSWPDGLNQVEAIVGSAIRSQNHDDLAPDQRLDAAARRGRVASFVMVRVPFKEAREVLPLPPELCDLLASRAYRLHHCVWHGVRDYWNDTSFISAKDQREITSLGWAPPRPNQLPTRGDASARQPDNGAGEDFLYMHRQMIGQVTATLSALGRPPIAAWRSPPEPERASRNAEGFAVPPSWDRQAQTNNEADKKALSLIKSDEYWASRMSFLDRRFKDPDYLAGLTLDQLGAKIEWLIHNPMHIRWASQPVDPVTGQLLPSGRPERDISEKWVKREVSETDLNGQVIKRISYYDDLNDTFSSHVHPVFWRLHGWVDDRINDWFAAHERRHPGEVVRSDLAGMPWFSPGKWVAVADPWVGPSNSHKHAGHHAPAGDADDVRVMERVHQLVFNPDVVAREQHLTSKFTVKAQTAQ